MHLLESSSLGVVLRCDLGCIARVHALIGVGSQRCAFIRVIFVVNDVILGAGVGVRVVPCVAASQGACI